MLSAHPVHQDSETEPEYQKVSDSCSQYIQPEPTESKQQEHSPNIDFDENVYAHVNPDDLWGQKTATQFSDCLQSLTKLQEIVNSLSCLEDLAILSNIAKNIHHSVEQLCGLPILIRSLEHDVTSLHRDVLKIVAFTPIIENIYKGLDEVPTHNDRYHSISNRLDALRNLFFLHNTSLEILTETLGGPRGYYGSVNRDLVVQNQLQILDDLHRMNATKEIYSRWDADRKFNPYSVNPEIRVYHPKSPCQPAFFINTTKSTRKVGLSWSNLHRQQRDKKKSSTQKKKTRSVNPTVKKHDFSKRPEEHAQEIGDEIRTSQALHYWKFQRYQQTLLGDYDHNVHDDDEWLGTSESD